MGLLPLRCGKFPDISGCGAFQILVARDESRPLIAERPASNMISILLLKFGTEWSTEA